MALGSKRLMLAAPTGPGSIAGLYWEPWKCAKTLHKGPDQPQGSSVLAKACGWMQGWSIDGFLRSAARRGAALELSRACLVYLSCNSAVCLFWHTPFCVGLAALVACQYIGSVARHCCPTTWLRSGVCSFIIFLAALVSVSRKSNC